MSYRTRDFLTDTNPARNPTRCADNLSTSETMSEDPGALCLGLVMECWFIAPPNCTAERGYWMDYEGSPGQLLKPLPTGTQLCLEHWRWQVTGRS